MSAVLEKREGNKIEFNMEIEAKDFKKSLQEAYMKNRKYFSIPGFRKGRAPRKLIENMYGEEIFYEEALNALLPDAYDEAIKELNIEPISTPDVDVKDIKEGENVKVVVTVEVTPEFELGQYKGVEVEEVKAEVVEEDIEAELKSVQEMNARVVPVEGRKTEEGDVLDINFEGFVDGEAFEGGKAENYSLELGSKSFIEGFEEQLIGKEKGEEVEVNVTFPEPYMTEELAGKEATFKVVINDVKVKELPELDDELAIDVSEFDTLDEYKEDIKKNLEETKKEEAKLANEENVVNKIIENTELDIPESMVENQIQAELENFSYRLQSQGLDLEQYLQILGKTVEDFKAEIKPQAEKKVLSELVLDKIAELEKIEASEEDVDSKLREIAVEYNQENVEDFIEKMKVGDLDYLYKGITREKALDFVIENAKFI